MSIGNPTLGRRSKHVAVIGSMVGYVLVFPAIYPVVDHFYFVLGILPVVLAGVLLGVRPAIYVVLAVFVVHFAVLAGPLGRPVEEAFVEAFPLVLLLIGGTVGYLRDLRVNLAAQRDELDRQNERLEEFARIVSHDLRNPLSVANGRLELAMEECDSEELAHVARAHDRMEVLIDDVLSLARAGETVREFETVELDELVETCWRNVATDGATLVPDVDRTVYGDRTRLQQLLENLLRNAVDHGSTKPPSQTLEDAAEHGESGVTITVGELDDGFFVADDGPGIPEENREKVFRAGFSTDDDGTGLGLNIVKRIVDAHGWEIRVAERDDGGARFEITGVESAA